MKTLRITFPDGKVYSVDYDFLNREFKRVESMRIGIPFEEVSDVDSSNVHVPTWIKNHLSWNRLRENAQEENELSQDQKNELNFHKAEFKLFEQ